MDKKGRFRSATKYTTFQSLSFGTSCKPKLCKNRSLTLIMRKRLSHKNIQSNPKACYMFIEKVSGYRGKCFFLTKKIGYISDLN
ncbi:MAG: hypothetical protein RBR08_11475 [Desulforegulaceae bacterium]|nr:hypothetical protein [Desulforegulaceae bacterium]